MQYVIVVHWCGAVSNGVDDVLLYENVDRFIFGAGHECPEPELNKLLQHRDVVSVWTSRDGLLYTARWAAVLT